MADQRTMAKLLRAPTEGYAEAIVVPPIPAEHFELKHSLINLIASAVASAVASAMTAMFKQHQVTPAPASVKAVEESTCGGAHSYQ
nr:reverse transcriptase domain-containing protein [Tanacetum cinerariifolium]